ncbi:HEPN domain-containing protein [Desulfobacula sp.]|uniref:HEPN domain-containing protein n=1 Tax=Desulfobacula sp. TaxID=2593537 RepID=UPI0025C031D5|nr:HEPN domain-containing protein [Desulfobacula sp.]MBC2703517.1 hypothetical protein [Desulfobacula sp.]
MDIEHTRYRFVIHHLNSSNSIDSEEICFSSPHFPSTKKDEDFIEGELVIKNPDCQAIPEEKVKICLEASFSLSSQIYCPVELKKFYPISLSINLNATGHCTYLLTNPNEVRLIWEKYLPLILQKNHEFHHAINWFMRSLKSNDSIDKFIYAWITLNCLYGYLSNTKGHHNGIRSLIYNNIPTMPVKEDIVRKHRTIFEFLASLDLVDKRNLTNWSTKLKDSLVNNNINEIIENGVSAIAIVRHTIFHGNVIDRNTEAERCIWPLNHLNAEILKNRLLKQ